MVPSASSCRTIASGTVWGGKCLYDGRFRIPPPLFIVKLCIWSNAIFDGVKTWFSIHSCSSLPMGNSPTKPPPDHKSIAVIIPALVRVRFRKHVYRFGQQHTPMPQNEAQHIQHAVKRYVQLLSDNQARNQSL